MTTNRKRHLKSDPIQFHLICQILAKFSGIESERAVSRLRKRKRKFFVVFTYSIKRAREIRKFHVAVVQRRLSNVQKRDTRAELLFY